VRWWALVAKEVQQHGAAVLGALVLLASVQVVAWGISLFENQLTLMNTVFELAVFPLPVFVFFLAGRLVVHDHARGTHEFLVALPIAPAHRVLARFGLGLAVVLAAGLASLVVTALLASRREGLPAAWLLQLFAQQMLHLWGWFGVAFGVAHFGRYRWLVWWTLMVAAVAYGTHAPDGPPVWWVGMMAESVDATRLHAPWAAVLPVVMWGAAGLGLSLLLSMWRGGMLLEDWFRPVTAYQRATLLGAGVAVMIGFDALDPLAPAGRNTWAELPAIPAERADLRVAGSADGPLGKLGVAVAAELDALGAEVGVERWPPIVLVRDRRPVGRPPVRPAPPDDDELARVVRVDLSAPHGDLVRRVVREALLHRLGDLAVWDDETRWVLDGAAPWWVEGDTTSLEVLAARHEGNAEGALSDWLVTSADLGPDVAPAVAWAGLVALEASAGRDAVLQLLREVLAFESATPIDGMRLRWMTRDGWVIRATGAPASWVDGWSERLGGGADALPEATVAAEGGQLVARWSADGRSPTAVEWAVLDSSLLRPAPGLPTEIVPIESSRRQVALPGDTHGRVVVRVVAWDATVGALVTGPWVGPP